MHNGTFYPFTNKIKHFIVGHLTHFIIWPTKPNIYFTYFFSFQTTKFEEYKRKICPPIKFWPPDLYTTWKDNFSRSIFFPLFHQCKNLDKTRELLSLKEMPECTLKSSGTVWMGADCDCTKSNTINHFYLAFLTFFVWKHLVVTKQ